MKRVIPIFFLAMFLFLTSVFAQETLTITTYYPAPFGVYTNLRLFPSAQPACAVANDEGVMYFDSGNHQLLVCTGDGAVPPHFTWQTAGGLWSLGGQIPNQYIYANNQNWKVGIGTNNPLERLTVTGATPGPGGADGILIDGPGPSELVIYNGLPPFTTANELLALGGVVSAENFATGTLAGDAVLRSVNGRLIFGTGNVNGNTPSRMTITNGGNVGIGTMNPQNKLDIAGSAVIGAGYAGSKTARANGLGVEGRVGIGTTNPDVMLHVKQNAAYNTNADIATEANGYKWTMSTDTFGSWILNRDIPGTLPAITVFNNGNMTLQTYNPGVGGANPPAGALTLSSKTITIGVAAGTVTTYGAFTNNSDITLKKDIVTIPDALERVSKLRGVNFHWKDKESGHPLQMGLIAQETEKEFPEVVYTEKDGKKSIAYTQLIGALVESIKELNNQVKELKEDNDSLKKTVQELKTKIK